MAFDGITVAALAAELSEKLTGAHIGKIAQPENDELLLTLKNNGETFRLLLSANAGLPLVYLTQENRLSPMTAPGFCMLLRKHIGSGRIVSVTQPGLERILDFTVEHLDELGDVRRKHLIAELMGKHSNLIFCDGSARIIDAIKRVPAQVSSVREVLPGKPYFIPDTRHKADPLTVSAEEFSSRLFSSPAPLVRALCEAFTGLGTLAAEEIVFRAGLDGNTAASSLSVVEQVHLRNTFCAFTALIRERKFSPEVYLQNGKPEEFSVIPMTCLRGMQRRELPSVSETVSFFYAAKASQTRVRQKSADIRHVIGSALERSRKKYELQQKQLADTAKRDKYRIYGELLLAYGSQAGPGADSLRALNYYTGEEITIPLDKELSPAANAQKYFARYNKLKRTCEALTEQCAATGTEIDYLESAENALEIASDEADLIQLKEELRQAGYLRRRGPKDRAPKITSRPLHYVTGDGYHLYVGKNNLQNEELTFRLASGNDWWFHAKGIPGSHVIVKTENGELPDRVFEQAAAAAAWYSAGRTNEKTEVDYVQKKQLRRVPGAKPGFVIYHTNYSMAVKPSLDGCTEVR